MENPKDRSARAAKSPAARTWVRSDVPDAAAGGASSITLGAATAPSTMLGTASHMTLYASPAKKRPNLQVWKITKEHIALPLDIAESFETWKANPAAFLWKGSLWIPSSPGKYYDYVLSLRGSTATEDRIRWRFIMTAFHDVISLMSHSSRNAITKEAVQFAVAILRPSFSSSSSEEVKNNIVAWAKNGKKYRALAKETGDTSCYFFLPLVGESILTKALTLDEIKKFGQLLVRLGIQEETKRLGAVELGESIETILKEPFESAALLQEHGQMISSISPQKVIEYARAVDENTVGSEIHEVSIPAQQWSVGEAGANTYQTSPSILHIDSLDTQFPELLHNIRVYFENMLSGDFRSLLTANSAKRCSDFDSYCFTATILFAKGSPDKFGYATSRATSLLHQILVVEHPRTLACFFEVFIHFAQTKSIYLTRYFGHHIESASPIFLPKEHPWGRICSLLGSVALKYPDNALSEAWRLVADIFDCKIGPLEPLAVSVRLDYAKRVFGTTNHLQEERLLRDLLAQFKDNLGPSTPRVMLNLAHNLNRQNRHDEAVTMASVVMLLLGQNDMYAGKAVEKIESQKIIAYAQYAKGDLSAEWTMQKAIQMVVEELGSQHSWVFEFKNVLHGWLRSWGLEAKATRLWEEIEDFERLHSISE